MSECPEAPFRLLCRQSKIAVAVSLLAILSLACVTVMAPFAARPTQESLLGEEPTYPEIPRVPLKDAKAAFDGEASVFVDVRSSGEYDEAHIPGALSIPVNELEGRLAELDKSQWIITYCT
jgi:hypothetical protein